VSFRVNGIIWDMKTCQNVSARAPNLPFPKWAIGTFFFLGPRGTVSFRVNGIIWDMKTCQNVSAMCPKFAIPEVGYLNLLTYQGHVVSLDVVSFRGISCQQHSTDSQ